MTDEEVETAEEEVPAPPAWATTPRPGNGRRPRPAERVRDADFPLALRGYDRAAVDGYVEEVAELVGELESTRMREPAVRRALEEVGEQTSEILRQAHETADEITARSRAQAEGRLQKAEREAAEIRRDAEVTAQLLASDNEQLWEERRQLIEEIRTLAQDVLGVADAALERLAQPEHPPREPTAAGDGDQGASRSTDQPPPADAT
jgi:cell division initiation protein